MRPNYIKIGSIAIAALMSVMAVFGFSKEDAYSKYGKPRIMVLISERVDGEEAKAHSAEKQIEKFILREAFRDMLPEQIANREKLRFAMGVGTDDVTDALVSKFMNSEEIKERPKAYYGLAFATFKELFYYDEFLKLFPPSYEKQTIRWDPFK